MESFHVTEFSTQWALKMFNSCEEPYLVHKGPARRGDGEQKGKDGSVARASEGATVVANPKSCGQAVGSIATTETEAGKCVEVSVGKGTCDLRAGAKCLANREVAGSRGKPCEWAVGGEVSAVAQ